MKDLTSVEEERVVYGHVDVESCGHQNAAHPSQGQNDHVDRHGQAPQFGHQGHSHGEGVSRDSNEKAESHGKDVEVVVEITFVHAYNLQDGI